MTASAIQDPAPAAAAAAVHGQQALQQTNFFHLAASGSSSSSSQLLSAVQLHLHHPPLPVRQPRTPSLYCPVSNRQVPRVCGALPGVLYPLTEPSVLAIVLAPHGKWSLHSN